MQLLRLNSSDLPYNPYEESNPYACQQSPQPRRSPVVGALMILGSMVRLSVRLLAGSLLAVLFVLVILALIKYLL
jgi:hypothetical protein